MAHPSSLGDASAVGMTSPAAVIELREERCGGQSVGLGALQGLIDAGAQLVDVLPAGQYREARLPGAVNIPLKQLDARTHRH